MLLTRPPLTYSEDRPFDLHVLGTPPAFILSQDQTLRKVCHLAALKATCSLDISLPHSGALSNPGPPLFTPQEGSVVGFCRLRDLGLQKYLSPVWLFSSARAAKTVLPGRTHECRIYHSPLGCQISSGFRTGIRQQLPEKRTAPRFFFPADMPSARHLQPG